MSKTSYAANSIVTGAGSGIGRAFAKELAARDSASAQVVCADIDLQAAERTAKELQAIGAKALAVQCDVTELEAIESLAEQAEAFFEGPTDIMINNAGIGVGGKLIGEVSIEQWRKTVDINLWGVIYGCHVFAPKLRERGKGGIINVASAASFGSAPRMGAYNTTKAAVVGLSETLHAEMHGTGVKVLVLCPTFVKTNIIKNSIIDENSRSQAQKVMDKQGMSPELVARKTLNAFDKGQVHFLPQADAKMSWMLKRFSPGGFTKGMGLLGKYMPQ